MEISCKYRSIFQRRFRTDFIIFNKNIKYLYQKEYRIAFDGIVGELKADEERIRLEYEDCSRKNYYTDKIDIIGAYRITINNKSSQKFNNHDIALAMVEQVLKGKSIWIK